MYCAPKHPTNKALELNRTEFYDGGASADGRQTSLVPITKWRQRLPGNTRRYEFTNIFAHLFGGRCQTGKELVAR